MQKTWVRSQIWEDPTSLRATKSESHNYWAHLPQQRRPVHPRARAPQQEKSLQRETHALQLESSSPNSLQLEKSLCSNENPTQPQINKYKIFKNLTFCLVSPLSLKAANLRYSQTVEINSRFSSVQFSCSVMSDSLRPHGLQHPRLPCPYLTYMQSTSCEMPGWMKYSWNQDCWEKYQ